MKRVIVTPPNEDVVLLNDINLDKESLIVFDDLPFDKKEIGIIKVSSDSNLWYIKNKNNNMPFILKEDHIFFGYTINNYHPLQESPNSS